MVSASYRDGKSARYTYDLAVRLIKADWESDGVVDVENEYDVDVKSEKPGAGDASYRSRLVRSRSGRVTRSFAYDTRGRMVSGVTEIQGEGGGEWTDKSEYDG